MNSKRSKKYFSFILFLILLVTPSLNAGELGSKPCKSYLSDPSGWVQSLLENTLQGLEQLRGDNGLLKDTIGIQSSNDDTYTVYTLNANTSPTNIAIDLLVQNEIQRNEKVDSILTTLSQVDHHLSTGLFFSWYSTENSSKAIHLDVSSVDNFHLALALWTVSETSSDIKNKRKARQLFSRMDFSDFYDEAAGLIGGNLRHQGGQWTREAYNFSNLGSEARVLYSAGWALGLFKKFNDDEEFIEKALASLKMELTETKHGSILKLWDGAAFQLYFPKMFLSEEKYSSELNRIYSATAAYMLSEGQRRHLGVPAAHSAVRISTEDKANRPSYRDKSGIKSLVSSDNRDLSEAKMERVWDATLSPYALLMAATSQKVLLLPELEKLKQVQSGPHHLYLPGLGFMDGLHVKGPHRGEIVPVQLALNQGMIALALLQMKDENGMGPSGKALYNNPKIRKRLRAFYQRLDQYLVRAAL